MTDWIRDTSDSLLRPLNGDVLSVILLVSSPLVALFGEKIFKPSLFCLGFVFAGYATLLAIEQTDAIHQISPQLQTVLICGAAIVGGLLLTTLYKFGVFAIGAVGGAIFSQVTYQLLNQHINAIQSANPETVRVAVLVLTAIIGGAITLYFMKVIIRVVTAFLGSYMAVASIDRLGYRLQWWSTAPLDPAYFFASPSTFQCGSGTGGDACHTLLVVWIILFALCLSFQFGLFRRWCSNGKQHGNHDSDTIAASSSSSSHHHYYDPNHSSSLRSSSLQTNSSAPVYYDPQMNSERRAHDERRA